MDIRERLARTLQAEAGGEGELGLLAAGSVIMNRAAAGGFGDNLEEVIMAPGQFSAWNLETGYAGGEGGLDMNKITPSETTYRVTDRLLSGEYDDPTGGALNYYNPNVVEPPWGQRAGGNWKTIGNHIFGTAGNRQPVTQEQRLAFSEQHRDQLESQQQGIASGETGAFRYDVEGEGFGPGEGLSMGTPVSGDPVTETREAALREQALDYAVGQRLTKNPRAPATIPQAGRQQPVMPGRVDTLGRNSPQRGDDLLMGSAGEDTLGANPPGRPSGRPRLSFNLSPDQPLPANPDTSRAFASANLQGLNEDELRLAFGPDVPEIDKGVMGFLGSTIGGPFKYNLQPEDVPQTVSEAAAALNERPGGDTPRSRFDAEAYKRREARRIFAADALEILSVGLGQISAGEALDLGPTLRAQSERHEQMRAALRGAPTGGGAGSAGGSYSDFLIPGNEEALRQFLIENDADHLLPMVDMGPEYKRLALQGVVDYITTAPERERQARRNQRVIDYYAQTRGPEAAQALAGDPAALEFATEQYYDEVFGEQGGGAAGSWTPQMSEDLASQFEELGMPDYARAVRNGGQEAYKTFLGELTKINETTGEAQTIANMSVEERALWGERNGLDPETSANLAADPPSLRAAVQRAREQRTQQQDLAARRDQMLERAAELNLPANHPLVRGILSGNEDDIATLNRMYEQRVQQEVFPEEEEAPVEYSEAEVRNAAADLGLAYEDDLDLFLNADDPVARQRAGKRIMDAYEEFNIAQAESRGTALGAGQVDTQQRNLEVQKLATSGLFNDQELALASAEGPEAAIKERERRLEQDLETQERQRISAMAATIGQQVADAQRDPELASIFENVQTRDELVTALQSVDDIGNLSEDVRTALAAMDDPRIRAALVELEAASSGKPTVMEDYTRERLTFATEQTDAIEEELNARRGLRAGMAQIIELVSDPSYDPDAGGPLAPYQTFAADLGRQVFGEGFAEAIQAEDENMAYRLIMANQGEFFGDFRAEGSGQMTEIEGKYFRAAMPNITDRAVKQALLAQRILRMDTLAQREVELRREWLNQQLEEEDYDAIRTQDGMMDYVMDGLEDMNLSTFPTVDLTSDNYQETLRQDLETGNITGNTVIRVTTDGETHYMFFKDLETFQP